MSCPCAPAAAPMRRCGRVGPRTHDARRLRAGGRRRDSEMTGADEEPAVGIEPTTARLRIGCSTTELRWQKTKPTPEEWVGAHALERTRTATPFGTTPSRWRVYQFHHQGVAGGPVRRTAVWPRPGGGDRSSRIVKQPVKQRAGLTGLEPATSGVTDRHSNQLSYSPRHYTSRQHEGPSTGGAERPDARRCRSTAGRVDSPNGSRTRLSTLKGWRPNR